LVLTRNSESPHPIFLCSASGCVHPSPEGRGSNLLSLHRKVEGILMLSTSIAMRFSAWIKFQWSTSLPKEKFLDLQAIWQTDAHCGRAQSHHLFNLSTSSTPESPHPIFLCSTSFCVYPSPEERGSLRLSGLSGQLPPGFGAWRSSALVRVCQRKNFPICKLSGKRTRNVDERNPTTSNLSTSSTPESPHPIFLCSTSFCVYPSPEGRGSLRLSSS
jgi:hypothetical protein